VYIYIYFHHRSAATLQVLVFVSMYRYADYYKFVAVEKDTKMTS